ncbi:SusC/RagA family TonB-linked outer membrane protein [Flavobacterium fluviatile]|uniref:SusC/RagA family TonB-linked outer membrane protein n=1 Tax=Flavobacterium fluviatile TaxID=1862387 RepID=UPI0013D491AA|nr:TonB-dependent receptor [Flavobacterium fluviatile]
MNLKTKLILMLIMLFNISLFAQDGYQLSGTVTDESNMPIPGVNVVIGKSNQGTSTDFDGKFQLKVAKGDVLQITYIGYLNQSVTISDQKTLKVVLKEDANKLEEVVVVGYGTRKKSQVTGSIAKIGGEEIAAIQSTRVDDALAGKLSGVRIQTQDGSPGADPKIQIRASASVNGNASPLVVVDGYPISGSIATINPNDIESLEVLKDAASSAIYGSRGANGVILVTTKKGKSGKPSFSYNTYASLSNRYNNKNAQMTAGEWGNKLEKGIANGTYDVSNLDPRYVQYKVDAYKNAPDVVSIEDWLFQTGQSINHDFSVTGGTEDVKYFASLGYQNTEGIALNQGFEKINARMNIDAKLGDKFKTGLSFNGFASRRDILGTDMRDLIRAYNISPIYHTAASIAFVQQLDQQRAALSAAGVPGLASTFNSGAQVNATYFNKDIYSLQPGMPVSDWHYGRANNGIGGTGDNGPALKLDNTKRYQNIYFGNVNTYLQYSIIKGLDIKTVLGADLNDTEDYFWKGLGYDPSSRPAQTNLNKTLLKQSSVLSETTLSYTKDIGKHNISAVAGIEFQSIYYKGLATAGINVPFGDIINYNLLAPADITVTERDETIVRKSIFGRLNYAYDDRYLFSASLRRDGDSRFGANKKFQTFPAVSVGWNVHKESFFKSELVSLLKFRLSTGSLGSTSDLGAYSSLSLLGSRATIFGTGNTIPSNILNPDLTWQTNTETNYGIDLGFKSNRYRLSVDYYTSDIKDILINQPISEILGNPTAKLNSGDVRSSGLEFELSGAIIQSKDFSWNLAANLSTVKTKITDLGGLSEIPPTIYGVSGRGPYFRNYVGGQIGEMWGVETISAVEDKFIKDPTQAIGINSSAYYVKDQQSPGEPGYGVIDKNRTVEQGGDLVKIGNNTPDFYWGLNSSMNYKDFDFSFQLQGSQGGEVWNVDPIYWNSEFGRAFTPGFDANNDAKADANGLPYLTSNSQLDAQIQDASFVALRNITLGYSFKPELLNKAGISSTRLYIAATNLLYFWGKDYTSFNPEGVDTTQAGYGGPTTYGVQNGATPIARSFTLGLNINF